MDNLVFDLFINTLLSLSFIVCSRPCFSRERGVCVIDIASRFQFRSDSPEEARVDPEMDPRQQIAGLQPRDAGTNLT